MVGAPTFSVYCRSGNIRRVLIFAVSRGGQIREFKDLAKIITIIALLGRNENSRILNFVKSPKITNSRKSKHAKITRSTVLQKKIEMIQCITAYVMHMQIYVNVIGPRLLTWK